MYSKLDKSLSTIGTYMNFAKAFDTVDHCILIEKFRFLGIRGKVNELIKSYLDNRLQRVRIEKFRSTYEVIRIGIPQGNIFGLCLFDT